MHVRKTAGHEHKCSWKGHSCIQQMCANSPQCSQQHISCHCALLWLLCAAQGQVNPKKGQPIFIKAGQVYKMTWKPAPPHPDVVMCCGGALQLSWSPMDSGVVASGGVSKAMQCESCFAARCCCCCCINNRSAAAAAAAAAAAQQRPIPGAVPLSASHMHLQLKGVVGRASTWPDLHDCRGTFDHTQEALDGHHAQNSAYTAADTVCGVD